MDKEELRRIIQAKKILLSETEKKRMSECVLKRLEAQVFFQHANTIMMYWSLPDELCTQDFIEKWAKEKIILLPSIENGKIIPRIFHSRNDMQKGQFGIAEPAGEVFTGKIDVVVVPALAFDKNRCRLGRGKGYYDRFLTGYDGVKCGIAWDFQIVDFIPCEAHDVPMDYVL